MQSLRIYDLVILKELADELDIDTPDTVPLDIEQMENIAFGLGLKIFQKTFPTCSVSLDEEGYSFEFDDPMYIDLFNQEHQMKQIRNYVDTVYDYKRGTFSSDELHEMGRLIVEHDEHPFGYYSPWNHCTDGITANIILTSSGNLKPVSCIGRIAKHYCAIGNIRLIGEHIFGVSGQVLRMKQFQYKCNRYYKYKYKSIQSRVDRMLEVFANVIRNQTKSPETEDAETIELLDSITLVQEPVSEEQQEEFNRAIERVRANAQSREG